MTDQNNDKLTYIADQIIKAEREGWFDKVNYTNATQCMDLLKEIQRYCTTETEDSK